MWGGRDALPRGSMRPKRARGKPLAFFANTTDSMLSVVLPYSLSEITHTGRRMYEKRH